MPYQPGARGFLTADLIARTDAFLRSAVRLGHSCELKCLLFMLYDADKNLGEW